MTHILFLVLMLMAQAAPGQPTSGLATAPMDVDAARRRIQAERLQEAERHTRQEMACYARFAVTDCLLTNSAQRRKILDQLQKQESAIQAQQRKERAFEQLQRVSGKAAAKDSGPAADP
jgi:hypothetical protein